MEGIFKGRNIGNTYSALISRSAKIVKRAVELQTTTALEFAIGLLPAGRDAEGSHGGGDCAATRAATKNIVQRTGYEFYLLRVDI